jgi:hypothetical protein
MDRYPQLDQMNRTGEILKYLDVMRYKRGMDAYTRKRNAELDAERNRQNALQRSVTQDSLQTKQNTRNALAQAYQAPLQDRADQAAGMMGAPRPYPTRQEAGQAVAAAGGSPEVSTGLLFPDVNKQTVTDVDDYVRRANEQSMIENGRPLTPGEMNRAALEFKRMQSGEAGAVQFAKYLADIQTAEQRGYKKEYGKRTAEADTAGNIEDQRRKAELKKSLPKTEGRIRSLNRQWNITQAKIDEAISTADGLSTAWPGTILKHVPYTDANKLHNLLLTIKANIGFDRLSEMRANSPTGGALGQVSELENLLLQATQGSLDQNQSPEELKKTLDMIRVNLAQLRAETELAFKGDYAEVLTPPNIQTMGRPETGGAPGTPPKEYPNARWSESQQGWFIKNNGKFYRVKEK